MRDCTLKVSRSCSFGYVPTWIEKKALGTDSDSSLYDAVADRKSKQDSKEKYTGEKRKGGELSRGFMTDMDYLIFRLKKGVDP